MRELSSQEEHFCCFCYFLYTRYKTVTHAMICALCERYHLETSSFHLPVGEMTITLKGVANLLHIPVEGRMLDFDKKEHGMTFMTRFLGMSDVAAVKASKTEYSAHISYPALKRIYEEHLTIARQLEVPQTREEMLERDRRRRRRR